ncbi:MAG: phosphatase, partial [Chloroflexi bacterium]|nr:phosphatase [Chloroflexota bacterium]
MRQPIPADALVLLVGAAASGKSTWAAARFRPTQIVSSDMFRELVADDAAAQGATRVAFQLRHLVARAR